MAVIGLSKPYIAKYDANGGSPSYTGGILMAKAVEMNIEIESASDNDFYADNEIAETESTFSNGTLTFTPDDLEQSTVALMLGMAETAVDGGKELVYDDNQNPPYLGFGAVVKKQKGGALKWRAIVLPKIKFSVPADAATTQGESIEWQTTELTATINRDDSTNHVWKREATFDTEEAAESYIKTKLGITA